MDLDPATGDWSMNHRTLTTIVAPRPIGWISSVSDAGAVNLAPFSYFNAVCTTPPIVLFGASERSAGVKKDTAANVLETGEFVVNMVTEKHIAAVDRSAEEVPPDVDEFEYADLEKVPSKTVDVPRVGGVPAALECVLYDDLQFHNVNLIIGEVQNYFVEEAYCTEGKIDTTKIDAVGRIGGPFFSAVDIMDFHRGDSTGSSVEDRQ